MIKINIALKINQYLKLFNIHFLPYFLFLCVREIETGRLVPTLSHSFVNVSGFAGVNSLSQFI